MNECKPLVPGGEGAGCGGLVRARAGRAARQGLSLVHFSAQPEPFLTLNTSPKRLNTASIPAFNTP